MKRFSIDESGYTGFDLLNPDQRFQGASAISISDEEASSLIKEYFPKLQAPELKYVSLARRNSNRIRLVSLQRDILSRNKCVTYVCDKRYLLTLLFLDIAVEPFYYKRGFDFYKDGQNYALASLLYLGGPALFGKNAYQKLMSKFQSAVKEKTVNSVTSLVKTVKALSWQKFPEALGPLAYESPECLHEIIKPSVNTDAALVVLQSLISRMEAMSDSAYRVEHDRSENLKQYNSLLQQYIDHNNDVEFKQTEIASIKFPLKLSGVTQVESKDSPSVQLADVLIGAAIEATNTLTGMRSSQSNPEDIIGLYADNQFIHMSPCLNFEEAKDFRRGTQAGEMIEYFSQHFSVKT